MKCSENQNVDTVKYGYFKSLNLRFYCLKIQDGFYNNISTQTNIIRLKTFYEVFVFFFKFPITITITIAKKDTKRTPIWIHLVWLS